MSRLKSYFDSLHFLVLDINATFKPVNSISRIYPECIYFSPLRLLPSCSMSFILSCLDSYRSLFAFILIFYNQEHFFFHMGKEGKNSDRLLKIRQNLYWFNQGKAPLIRLLSGTEHFRAVWSEITNTFALSLAQFPIS